MAGAKVTILGGCGAVGSVAVRALAGLDAISQVVIADINFSRARDLASQIGPGKVSAVKVNAEDPSSVTAAIAGSHAVLNCIGPFYKTVSTILRTVIGSRINYVDICDDVDATLDILAMDDDAKRAGVTALIGMGNSPGATNLLAKFASETLLDTTDSIDIFHTHGGEPVEGEGVIGHRLHCMSIDIPMFLDGKLVYVKFFGPDGIALRQTFDFPVVGDNIPLYPYPHPEQVTLPRHITVRNVRNKGSVLPIEYYNLIRDICALGLSSKEPIDVKGIKGIKGVNGGNGRTVVPYDFAVAYILKQREKILKETQFGSQRGCCSVIVKGTKEGRYREYRFHMASRSQALGEGTGIPAAIGVILMIQGKVYGKGVFPPEACVHPTEFMSLISQVMTLDTQKEGGGSFGGVVVQSVDEKGTVTDMNIS